jgi:hypothetical protein
MNDKKNARRIIAFDNPERVLDRAPVSLRRLLRRQSRGFPEDPAMTAGDTILPVGSQWVDIWGVRWHREHEGVMGFPTGAPARPPNEALERYTWPDPDDPRICSRSTSRRRAGPEETFLVGSHRDTLWEKSYMLVGMER